MSRVGKQPILLPNGVSAKLTGNVLHVKGAKGEMSVTVHPEMKVVIEEKQILIQRPSDSASHRSLHGLTRTLVSNAVVGCNANFSKKLEIQGVGFKINVQGGKLLLNIGLSHPVEFVPPKGITISIDAANKNLMIVEGVDKQMVGEIASRIRRLKKPEPYKGKGIRYEGEHVRRKAGKSAAK